jgi:hypothetical protein
MTPIESFLVITHGVASMAVLYLSIEAINAMTPKTYHAIRVAYIGLTVASFSVLIQDMFGLFQANFCDAIYAFGMATFLFFNRRTKSLLEPQDNRIPQ